MHLVSRVNKSNMLEIRKYLMLPVTKILMFGAALLCSVIGIVGYIENKDAGKFVAILALSALTIGLIYGIEYVLALAKYKRLQVLYEMDVLNMHVYFDDDFIRIVSLGNREISRLDYCEVTRYCETEKYAVIFAGWQIFIFDKKQAGQAGLQQHLEARGVTLVSVKTM